MHNKINSQRYYLIDSLRGFALLNMVIFHLLYDVFQIYGIDAQWCFQPLTIVWERFICISFIIISGISLNFSHNAYKRGIILNVLGFIITVVTFIVMPGETIWFGILNFLGCAMLILQPLRCYFDKISSVLGMAVSIVLFAVLYGVPNKFIGFFNIKLFDLPHFMYGVNWLSFLGFHSADFSSSDYFPIIPWIFLFFAGYFIWRLIKTVNADKYFTFSVPILSTAGRYSLWIYLAHQPLILGILMLVFSMKN